MIQFGVDNHYYSDYTRKTINGWGIIDFPAVDFGRLEEFCKENRIVIARQYPYMKDDTLEIYMSIILQGTDAETQMLLKLMFS